MASLTASLVCSAVMVAVAAAPITADALEQTIAEVTKSTPGPRGGIAVIGDSVLFGSVLETGGYGPSIEQMLSERGWGPVRARAGVGFQTGRLNPDDTVRNLAVWLIQQRLEGFDPAVVAVNLGANDISVCNGSVTCAVANIRYLLDVIGPGRQVWWPLITMEKSAYQQAWNSALITVAGQRSNLFIWDWPSAQVSNGVALGTDRIHLPTAAAYRQRSRLMADDITARMGLAQHTGAAQPLPAATAPLDFLPITPRRLIDTRETGGRVAAGGVVVVDVRSLVPEAATASAVAVNVTAADPAAAGFLTAWPCGTERPLASSANYPAGQPRSGHTTSRLGDDGTLCVFSSAPSDVVVDIQGVFVASGGQRFTAFTPQREADTRSTGRSSVITVAAPLGASAVAVTLAVTGSQAAGFLTAYPCGTTPPVVANVNFAPGETIAGAAFVPVGVGGTFCVFSNVSVDVIVDLTGTFSNAGTLRYVPVQPTRMVDTRDGTGGWRGLQGRGQTIEIGAAPSSAVAVTGTITMVGPMVDGYLTGTVCGAATGQTSSVNAAAGSVVANSLTVALSPGGHLCINAFSATHTVFDTTGWWVA